VQTVKTTDNHIIVKKRSGRYGVKLKRGGWVNGEEKVQLLLAEGLIKQSKAQPKEEAAEGEAPAEA